MAVETERAGKDHKIVRESLSTLHKNNGGEGTFINCCHACSQVEAPCISPPFRTGAVVGIQSRHPMTCSMLERLRSYKHELRRKCKHYLGLYEFSRIYLLRPFVCASGGVLEGTLACMATTLVSPVLAFTAIVQ